jgi:hypothetical protein
MAIEDTDTDTLEAEAITEDLLSEYNSRTLEKVVSLLEKAIRRVIIQKILEEKD